MLCAVLRQHGVPARVRCGFGRYFSGHPYHDHWVCEYWARDEQRWVLVDAELDEPHRNLLRFDFEPTDVPRTAFITGIEAWQRCRTGAIDPEQLGHGTSTGLFFARVNLARDLLALAKIETSSWDTWRAARQPHLTQDEAALLLCDDLAQRGEEGRRRHRTIVERSALAIETPARCSIDPPRAARGGRLLLREVRIYDAGCGAARGGRFALLQRSVTAIEIADAAVDLHADWIVGIIGLGARRSARVPT